MQIWIGTSGYSYPDWVGCFYPPGTSTGRMLRYYFRQFPLVELNFTFYRPPTAAMLVKLAEQTPPVFQFLVKLPRSLSHEEKTSDLRSFCESAEALHDRGQLLGLLCQLPQATHRTRKHETWLEKLASELGRYRLAVEFRHRSWSSPDVSQWLTDRKIELVAVDAPDLPALYPSGPVRSSANMYVRFHSRNAENWYLGDKERYDYSFSEAELGEWIDYLQLQAAEMDKVFLLFNNCHRGQAAANARRMKELLARTAPQLELVTPFANETPDERQRLLFE
jgi:uncharacterized protein YecE (DUF72 family)